MKKVHLSREQRYTISVMYRQGCAQKLIALTIGKSKSVISRELKRNANLKGKYSFGYSQDMAELQKERSKKPRKKLNFYSPKEIFFVNLQEKVALRG